MPEISLNRQSAAFKLGFARRGARADAAGNCSGIAKRDRCGQGLARIAAATAHRQRIA